MQLDAYIHAPFEGSPWRWVDGLEAFGVDVVRLAALSITTPTLDAWDAATITSSYASQNASTSWSDP